VLNFKPHEGSVYLLKVGTVMGSSKERILSAINLEEPDTIPLFDFLYEHKSFENVLGTTFEKITPEVIVKGHKALGLDMMCLGSDPPEGWKDHYIAPNIKVDEWGIKWKITPDMRTLPWYLEGPIKTEEDFNRYVMPDPEAPGRLNTIKEVQKLVKDEMAISATFPIGGPFTVAFLLTGGANFLKFLVLKPSFTNRLLEMACNFCIKLGERFLEEGVDIIFLNDDLGDIHGPFLAPKLFKERVLPYLEKVVKTLKRKGAYVLLHCDGNINLILEDLVNMGINGYHPMERKAGMNIKEIKEKYGNKICLIGNVDASTLLPFGSLEEIKAQVEECIKIAAPGGGYIFASDHSIHPGIPGFKAKFLFKAAKEVARKLSFEGKI
jgi:uroporphyrinogen decarboxylase